MATKLKLKRGDTARTVTDQLKFDGAAIDITGAVIKFLLRKDDGTIALKNAAAITNPAEGRVIYTFGAGETDVAGNYRVEWEITFNDGRILTVPDDGYHELQILTDLG